MDQEQNIKGNYAKNWNVKHLQLQYYAELFEAQKKFILAMQLQGNVAHQVKYLRTAFYTYYSCVRPLFNAFWKEQKHSLIKTYFPHIKIEDFDNILELDNKKTLEVSQAIIMWSQIDGPFANITEEPDEYIW